MIFLKASLKWNKHKIGYTVDLQSDNIKLSLSRKNFNCLLE